MVLASHSYKHGAMAGYNVAQMRDCAQKFKNEVTPLIVRQRYMYILMEAGRQEKYRIFCTKNLDLLISAVWESTIISKPVLT